MADDIFSLLGGAKPKAKAKAKAATKTKPKAVAKAKPKAATKSKAFTQGVAAGLKGSPPTGKTPDWLDGYIQGSKARKAAGSAVAKPKAKTKPSAGALTTSKAKPKAKLKPSTGAQAKPEAKGPSVFKKFWESGVKPSTPPVENGAKGTTQRPLSEPELTALAARVAKRIEPQSKSLSEPELNKLTAQVASRMEPRHAALSEAQLSMFAAKVVVACNESHKRPGQTNGELQDAVHDYKQTIGVPKGRKPSGEKLMVYRIPPSPPQGRKPSAEKLMGYRSAIKQKVSTLRKGRGGIVR